MIDLRMVELRTSAGVALYALHVPIYDFYTRGCYTPPASPIVSPSALPIPCRPRLHALRPAARFALRPAEANALRRVQNGTVPPKKFGAVRGKTGADALRRVARADGIDALARRQAQQAAGRRKFLQAIDAISEAYAAPCAAHTDASVSPSRTTYQPNGPGTQSCKKDMSSPPFRS